MQIVAPLVGSRFYPPAVAILASLGMDEPLILRREPENPYDPNAIEVFLPSGWEEKYPELAAEIDAKGEVKLGHISRDVAAEWAPVFDEQGEAPPATLAFSASGAPRVALDIPAEDLSEEDLEEEEDI
jgi:hypothetical protein